MSLSKRERERGKNPSPCRRKATKKKTNEKRKKKRFSNQLTTALTVGNDLCGLPYSFRSHLHHSSGRCLVLADRRRTRETVPGGQASGSTTSSSSVTRRPAPSPAREALPARARLRRTWRLRGGRGALGAAALPSSSPSAVAAAARPFPLPPPPLERGEASTSSVAAQPPTSSSSSLFSQPPPKPPPPKSSLSKADASLL